MTKPRGTVLVTGGAGYIGSHTCKALAREDYLPVTYDNLVTGNEWAAKWGPLEQGDILDRTRLDEVIAKHHPGAVIHFAGVTDVGESVMDPAKYYSNNVTGTLILLEAMRAHNIERIVFSSTAALYGVPEHLPVGEDAMQRPISPYGHSKLMVERMLAGFGSAYGLKWSALRYFNVAGADPDGETGQLSKRTSHLIPLVLSVAYGHRAQITVYGTDYPTPDGTCIRDYIHVTDLAEGHVRALGLQAAKGTLGAYNLGTGRGFSVREIIESATRVTGCQIRAIDGPRRPGDPASLVSDSSKARAELGWQPKFLEVDALMETAWNWYRSAQASGPIRSEAMYHARYASI